MQTKTIHEGSVQFEGVTGVDRRALNRACDIASKAANKRYYDSMRDSMTAAMNGHRAWPEKLTPETVASWIAANVSYSMPSDAHLILEAMILENHA